MKRMLLLLAVCVAGAGLQAQGACAPPVVERQSYYSAWLSQEMYYTVVLPPCYDAAQTYPAVTLMHGSNDDDGHWIRLGLPEVLAAGVASDELLPMIVVLPFGNNIANRNWFENVSWSNVFLTELLPSAWAAYPSISRDPQQNAIGGISRGGFWAYQIGLRHPDLFGSIGGHSAFFDRFHAQPPDNPLDLVLSEPNTADQRLWLDRGQSDYAAPGLDIMGERMTERGLAHSYTIYPQGEHNNTYWSAHVSDYLRFYSAGFARPVQADVTPAPVTGFATNTPAAPLPTATLMAEAPILQTALDAAALYDLFLPVVAFPSLRTSVSTDELNALIGGQPAVTLVMDVDTQAALYTHGITFENVQVVDTDEIDGVLWSDYDAVAIMPFHALTLRLRALWVDDQPVFGRLEQYPLAFDNPTGAFDPRKLGRVTASGVTALTRQTTVALDETTIQDAASGIRWYVDQSDLFHTSNEVSIADPCPNTAQPGRIGVFCSKREHFELLTEVGVDLIELTGNHNTDYGFSNYAETRVWYQQNDIPTVGGGMDISEAQAPFIRDINGTTIGWIACNDVGPYYALVDDLSYGEAHGGAAPCDRDWLRDAIPSLDKQVDVVIVTVQQLEVEDYLPPQSQRNFFQLLIDLGADFVGGTAAHKPQTFQFYNDRLIHHGFGNLFFDQPFWGNSRFFMDTLLLYDGRLMSLELFPGIIDNQVRPRLMTAEERANFLFFMLRQQNGF